ncbi:MAG: hypothetical protein JO346_00850 [Alphaproteobacteria bacterium]|nr:hypothetical protein [Alphaproteobacteria bacterium]
MTLSDLAALGSFVSGVAVLVSLVFLYFQLRQVSAQVAHTEKNSRAVVAQERTSRIVDIQMQIAAEPSLAEALEKGLAGDTTITTTQFTQFQFYGLARFLNSEDSYFQHRNGLLNTESFATFERTIRVAYRAPGLRALWKSAKVRYDPEYVAFVDRVVAGIEAEPPFDQFARWKADLAAGRASAEGAR